MFLNLYKSPCITIFLTFNRKVTKYIPFNLSIYTIQSLFLKILRYIRMAKGSRNAAFEPQVFATDVASELRLQLRGSSPRGIESACGVRIRVVVLLRFGSCRTDGCRGGWSTMHLLTRSRNFPLKKRGGRLTGSLVFP